MRVNIHIVIIRRLTDNHEEMISYSCCYQRKDKKNGNVQAQSKKPITINELFLSQSSTRSSIYVFIFVDLLRCMFVSLLRCMFYHLHFNIYKLFR